MDWHLPPLASRRSLAAGQNWGVQMDGIGWSGQ